LNNPVRAILPLSPKKLLLLDGIGALLTAALLYFLLGRFDQLFGMPKKELDVLAIIGLACAVYSFSCYFLLTRKWRSYLTIIAFINILYCIGTIILLQHYYRQLTVYGILYFCCEILVITILVYTELKTAGVINKAKNLNHHDA
jgi:hypothetical protein